ncbi:MAG: hypothetical protein WCP06_11310 [Verrucomicrobiota bacterium]
MSERKWWLFGLAGAIVFPVALMAVGFWLDRTVLAKNSWPELNALFVSFAVTFGIMGVSVLPVWPILRFLLVLIYVPLSFLALNAVTHSLWPA